MIHMIQELFGQTLRVRRKGGALCETHRGMNTK